MARERREEGEGTVAALAEAGPGPKIRQAGQLRDARFEAMRGLLAVSVVVGHAWQFAHIDSGGAIATYGARLVQAPAQAAVPLFFAISAYLLSIPFFKRDFGGGGPINYRTYYFNRLFRIMPLYWISTLVLLAFQATAYREDWWIHMLMLQGFSVETARAVNAATWSVVVDVQFYILLPLIAAAIAWIARGRRNVALGLLLLMALGGVVAHALSFQLEQKRVLVQHSIFAAAAPLAAGMIVALLRTAPGTLGARLESGRLARADLWVVLAAGCVALAAYDYHLHQFTALACLLLVGAMAIPRDRGVLLRPLNWRPIAAMGIATYSIYIWQGPMLHELYDTGMAGWDFLPVIAVAVPLAVAIGLASFHGIETPFLRLRRQWSRVSAPVDRRAPAPARPEPVPSEG